MTRTRPGGVVRSQLRSRVAAKPSPTKTTSYSLVIMPSYSTGTRPTEVASPWGFAMRASSFPPRVAALSRARCASPFRAESGSFRASCAPSRRPGSRAPSPRDPGATHFGPICAGTRESAFTFGIRRVVLSMRPGAVFSSSVPRWRRAIQNLGHAECLGRTASRTLS